MNTLKENKECSHCEGTGYDNRSRCMNCNGSGVKPLTTKKLKDSYSREEVYNLLIDLWAADLNKREEIEYWTKENL